jgi:hypothetical protein
MTENGMDRWDEEFDARPADACEAAAATAILASSGEASDAELRRLAEHRAACPACAAEAGALEADAARVGSALRAAGTSRDLSEAVLARIRRPAFADSPSPTRLRRLVLVAAAAVVIIAAGIRPVFSGKWWWSNPERTAPGPSVKPPSAPVADFTDETAAAGIDFRHHAPLDRLTWMAESVGSGVAAADFDGDGRPDLFFADAWSLDEGKPAGAGNRLYRNRGDGTFEDVTASAGVDVPERIGGVLAADLDNDGDADLVLAGYGRVRILRNRGGARFEDATDEAGLPAEPDSWFTCAAAADFDRDGVLDLFVTRYADQEGYRRGRMAVGAKSGREGFWRGLPVFSGPQPLHPQGDRLYRGLGGGRFREVTAEALEEPKARYGFQPVATDADGDGWIDVYVANDTDPNSLWRNLGGMRFRDVGMDSGCALDAQGKAQAGMGVAVGDLEGDGLPEIVVTNFSNDHTTLYGNSGAPGRPTFTDRSYTSGVGPHSFRFLGWGALFADLDLDGCEDLLTANGHLYPNVTEMPDLHTGFAQAIQAYRGVGDGSFGNETGRAGPGLAKARVHRGLASLDYDGDGRLDVVATTLGGPPVLLRNQVRNGPRNWIGFRLRGTKSPRDPAGARVAVTAGGRTQTRELHLGDSFASSSEPVLRFGLGTGTKIDRIVVRWPSGEVEERAPLAAGRVHELVEGR